MDAAVARLKKNGGNGSNCRAVYDALTFLRKRLSLSAESERPAADQHGNSSPLDAVCRFRELGGPQCLLRIVQDCNRPAVEERPSKDYKILDATLSILGNCCLDYETRKIVGRLQGVQYLVEILESSMQNGKASLMNRACRTLANLALDDRLADDILKSDAVKVIIQLLEELPSENHSSQLKQSAVRALRVLAATPTRRDCLVIHHGVARVLGKLLVSADEDKDEARVVCVLRALVVVSVNCNQEFTEQVQCGINCLERLVKLASSELEKYRDPSLHVLANLSGQESMRSLLGNAGAIECLVRHLGICWETSSSGWHWAVDALCQCTRESVNRVKVRNSTGGLGHLVKLLRESLDGRLWLCGLSAIVNFVFDDVSFSRMVDDEKMVEALLEKFEALTKLEKAVRHYDSTTACASLPLNTAHQQGHSSPPPATPSVCDLGVLTVRNQHTWSYSPENSPPYWTCFSDLPSTLKSTSCSPPPLYQGMISPNAMSPARDDFSPEPSFDVEEFCYSPVYESGSSDDEESNAKFSENSVASESPQVMSPVSDRQSDVVGNVGHSTGLRAPIFDILFFFSKLSLEEHPRTRFLCLATLDALLEYLVTVESPLTKAKRVLHRITRNPLCFERLVTLRWVVSLRRRLAEATPHSRNKCAACDSLHLLGNSLLYDLKLQAESPFGVGVLLHLMLAGRNTDEKVSALLIVIHLVRLPRLMQKILLEANGMAQLVAIVMDEGHADHEVVFEAFVHFAEEIVFPRLGNVNGDGDGKIPNAMITMHCYYEDAFKDNAGNDDGDLVRLAVQDVSDDNRQLLAHRSVLSNACDVFGAMFNGNFAESRMPVVVISNASFEALQYVVHHIYSCGSCPAVNDLTDKVHLECLVLADKLLMPDVKKSLCDCLMTLKKLPSVKVYVYAKVYNYPTLLQWIMSQVLSPKFSINNRKRVIRRMMRISGFRLDISQKLADTILAKVMS